MKRAVLFFYTISTQYPILRRFWTKFTQFYARFYPHSRLFRRNDSTLLSIIGSKANILWWLGKIWRRICKLDGVHWECMGRSFVGLVKFLLICCIAHCLEKVVFSKLDSQIMLLFEEDGNPIPVSTLLLPHPLNLPFRHRRIDQVVFFFVRFQNGNTILLLSMALSWIPNLNIRVQIQITHCALFMMMMMMMMMTVKIQLLPHNNFHRLKLRGLEDDMTVCVCTMIDFFTVFIACTQSIAERQNIVRSKGF